ncbi:cohesin subunit SA-3 [Gastrophryne carolinensis]
MGKNKNEEKQQNTKERSEGFSDDGSDFEDILKSTQHKGRRTFISNAKAPKRTHQAQTPPDKDLFEAIRRGKSAIQVLVDDWLDIYKKDHSAALLELINFLMQACGCKGVVNQEMLDTMDNAEIIRRMTEDFNEDSTDYPLSLSTLPWKKFCLNFGEFFEKLVISCQYNIMYDDVLMDSLIAFLTGLSDSQVRAFRHTSTFGGMKIMSALVKVAKDLTHHIETSRRQLDTECTKSPEKRAPGRVESLQEKIQELTSYIGDVGNMMNNLFKGVFIHRFRDVHADIRALCMVELGIWIKTYPHSFLNDSYLKYLGWTLHDKQGHVRLQCVRSLQEIYTIPGHAGKVELFTNRFKDRLVFMVHDKEPHVAAEAIRLISLIHKSMANLFTNEDCKTVDVMVYTTNRLVASAAGAFLYQRLVLHVDLEELSPPRRTRLKANAVFFRRLISFHNSMGLHEHAAYVVDSLWDAAANLLKDWECQTDLLLVGAGLNDLEESSLIDILVSTLRQAAEGTSPIGRMPAKKVQSVKERKAHSEDKVKLSRHMIVALPHLLAKFSADADKMEALLKVVGHLEQEMYCNERLEKYFDLLLTQVQEILEKHTNPKVLEGCSRALYALSDPRQTLHKKTDLTVSQLVDGLTDHFMKLIPDILEVSELDEDDVYNAAATMKRLYCLHSSYDLTKWQLFDPCCQILQRAVDSGEIPEQVVPPALICCHFSLLWTLDYFSNSEPSQDEIAALRKKLHCFCDLCQSFLSDLYRSVREQAFILLSDLLVVFGERLSSGERSYLQPLVYKPDLTLQAELSGFLVDHVFTNAEEIEGDDKEQQAELHNRRRLLAGYCKLILYNILELHYASEVFKYYIKYYVNYGDIIKETLHRSRSVSREESTRTILLTLTQTFTGFCLETSISDRRYTQTFLEIRELSRRFSLLLGPDQLRIRKDIVLLHTEGIKFALRPSDDEAWSTQNILFLDVLSEFSPKLLKQDKKALLQYFEEMCKQCIPADQPDEEDEIWAPLHAYKKSLQTDSDAGAPTTSSRRAKDRRPSGSHQVSPHRKKRRTSRGGLQDTSSVMGEGERRQPPLLSSTMLQERSEPSSPRGEPEDADSDSDFETSFNLLQEEEEGEEMVIDDVQSSAGSSMGEEHLPDLMDSALLETEE